MVDKNELRAAFSARLHEALDDAGVRARGRGVDVHLKLKDFGVHKTTQAVSKWLNGEAIAEHDSTVALSEWLGVRREWLEYGTLPKSDKTQCGQPTHGNCNELNKGSSRCGECKVPLISWGEARAWCERDGTLRKQADNWICCPMPVSSRAFALRVQGDSMTNLGPGRSYPEGCIIFVDPKAEVRVGDRVIARALGASQMTFKVFAEDAGRQFLRPINSQYPIMDVTGDMDITVKVVGSFYAE